MSQSSGFHSKRLRKEQQSNNKDFSVLGTTSLQKNKAQNAFEQQYPIRAECRRTKRDVEKTPNVPARTVSWPDNPVYRPYAAKGSSMNDDDDEAALREVGGQEEGKLLLVPRFDHFFPLLLSHFSCFDKLFP